MSVVEVIVIEPNRPLSLRFYEMFSEARATNFIQALENNYARCSPGRTLSVFARILDPQEI